MEMAASCRILVLMEGVSLAAQRAERGGAGEPGDSSECLVLRPFNHGDIRLGRAGPPDCSAVVRDWAYEAVVDCSQVLSVTSP